jgi:G6PDH family F420-dependent oxidoreductase
LPRLRRRASSCSADGSFSASAQAKRSTSTSLDSGGRQRRFGSRCSKSRWRSFERCGREKLVNRRGPHYTVENARIYSCPNAPPPIYVSSFGAKSLGLAARIADGLITTKPDAQAVATYRSLGGRGPTVAAMKVCWGEDERKAMEIATELWPTEVLEGQLSQELPMPRHFEQAVAHVTPEMVGEVVSCGPDPERHLAAIQRYLDAGFDELYISQIGSNVDAFLRFFDAELRPRLSI